MTTNQEPFNPDPVEAARVAFYGALALGRDGKAELVAFEEAVRKAAWPKRAKPNPAYAPVYCAIYPDLAAVARSHGYALAVHGSLQRDFDLIAVPWVARPSDPDAVIADLERNFSIRCLTDGTDKGHGRIAYTISIGWGECAVDLSFMARWPS